MNDFCRLETKKGVTFVKFTPLINDKIDHYFTTRESGVSSGSYASLNPGITTGDLFENIQKNRSLIEESSGYTTRESITLEHGDRVLEVKTAEDNNGKGIYDAVITRVRNLPLVIYYADCVPVFLFDPDTPAIALIHAGWRGSVAEICRKTVWAMQKSFKTLPSNLTALIAPSIGQCCFETDIDVYSIFQNTFAHWQDLNICISNNHNYSKKSQLGKKNIDLWEINKRILLESGLKKSNIFVSGICTSCRSDLFFSYRRDNRITGRMGAMIVLK